MLNYMLNIFQHFYLTMNAFMYFPYKNMSFYDDNYVDDDKKSARLVHVTISNCTHFK